MNYFLDAGVVAIIVALVSTAKSAGLSGRWAPLLSVVLGLVVDIAFKSVLLGSVSTVVAAFAGLVSGLTASGLYSGVKASFSPSAE